MTDVEERAALVEHLEIEQFRKISRYPQTPIPWKALRAEFDEWDRSHRG